MTVKTSPIRAAVVNTRPSSAIEIVEAAEPTPAPGQVVIEVEAAGVNPVDIQTRTGIYHRLGWASSPGVGLGWDAAGTIVAVDAEVEGFALGGRVAVLIGGVDRSHGAYAKRVALPAGDIALAPAGLSSFDAATVPLNATTASQGLDLLGFTTGQMLLITRAGGAVGGYALELATQRGFAVTGLARPADEAFVQRTSARFISTLHLTSDSTPCSTRPR